MTSKSIKHELVTSSLVGPLRYTVPIISYAVLYPLLVRRFGMELLGLWSLLSTILTSIALADIGFSTVFTREMAGGDGAELARIHGVEYKAARVFYLGLLGLLLALLAASFPLWRMRAIGLPNVSSPRMFGFEIAVLLASGFLLLMANLDKAILMARTRIVYTQVVSASTPLILFTLNVIGALLGHPLEGFALGALLSSSAQYVLYRRNIRRTIPEFLPACSRHAIGASLFSSLAGLMKRGKYLYLNQIGELVREPIFRFIVGGTLGLAAVSVFDIAFRLTVHMRALTTDGISSALFPTMSRLINKGEHERASRLFRLSMIIMLFIGASTQGGICMMAEPFYAIWLGRVPEHLIPTTFVFAACLFLRTAYLPFRNLLMASRLEHFSALGVWMHVFFSIAMLPAIAFFHLSLPVVAGIWGLGFILSVPALYTFTIRNCRRIVTGILNPTTSLMTIASIACFSIMLGLHAATPSFWSQFLIWGALSAGFGLAFLWASWRKGWLTPAHFGLSFEKTPASFLSIHTQFKNIGDALINRELIRLAAVHGPVFIDTSRAPASFVKTLGLTETGNVHLLPGSRVLFMKMLARRLKGQPVYYFLCPGGIGGRLAGKKLLSFLKLPIFLSFSLIGIRLCHVGSSFEKLGADYRLYLKIRSRFMHRFLVRDAASADILAKAGVPFDGLMPDLAFNLFKDGPRTSVKTEALGVSFRTDLHGRHLAEARDFVLVLARLYPSATLHVIAQVEYDVPGMQDLAAWLQKQVPEAKVVLYINTRNIDELQEYSSRLDAIFSNRLHVLLLAGSRGAAMIPCIDETNGKIAGLFKTIGIPENILQIEGPLTRPMVEERIGKVFDGRPFRQELGDCMARLFS